MITKLINAKKAVLKKDYEFHKVFDILDELNSMRSKLYEYKPVASNKIDIKNNLLEYLKKMEGELIDMFSNPSIIKEVNNASGKEYMKEKLEMRSEKHPRHREKKR